MTCLLIDQQSLFIGVMDCPCVTLTHGVQKLQDLVQKIRTLKEAQEEAETLIGVAELVSSCTVPWQETSAGRSQQMAHGELQSRCARDEQNSSCVRTEGAWLSMFHHVLHWIHYLAVISS